MLLLHLTISRYDTCQPYMACSAESQEGFCPHSSWECTAINICETCSTYTENGGECSEISSFPNATISEYGNVSGELGMMQEIFHRGPITCSMDAGPLNHYVGGVINVVKGIYDVDHDVGIVGWGVTAQGQKYWRARNSWGEYWGELGFFRIERGSNMLRIENDCVWATPDTWTEVNIPCDEDGSNCHAIGKFTDPAWEHTIK